MKDEKGPGSDTHMRIEGGRGRTLRGSRGTVTVTSERTERALDVGIRHDQHRETHGVGAGRCGRTVGSEITPEEILKETGRSQRMHQECWR